MRLGRRGRAEDNAIDAGVQIRGDHAHVADAAAHLTEQAGTFFDGDDRLEVGSAAVFGAFEVDHMKLSRPLGGEIGGDGFGAVAVNGHPRVIAALQPDRLAGVKVDGRIDQHEEPSSSQKARRMSRPTEPLFSGWNWQPNTLSRATAAVSQAPYSVSAVT